MSTCRDVSARLVVLFLAYTGVRGATDEGVLRTLPGDELVPAPPRTVDMGRDHRGAARTGVAWLVQMGQDRAGFYTYEWFENGLLRLNIHNADRIVPEWQNITVGDRMWFDPERYPIKPRSGPRIVAIEPNDPAPCSTA